MLNISKRGLFFVFWFRENKNLIDKEEKHMTHESPKAKTQEKRTIKIYTHQFDKKNKNPKPKHMIITNNKHPKGSKNKRTNFKKLEPLVHRKKK